MQPHIRAFVLDKDRKSLMPCHAARARKLLKKGKAAVFRRFPFTIWDEGTKNGSDSRAQLGHNTVY